MEDYVNSESAEFIDLSEMHGEAGFVRKDGFLPLHLWQKSCIIIYGLFCITQSVYTGGT